MQEQPDSYDAGVGGVREAAFRSIDGQIKDCEHFGRRTCRYCKTSECVGSDSPGQNNCSRAHEHLKDNGSVIEDYATGDTVQFIISTSEKTLHGKNEGLGIKRRQKSDPASTSHLTFVEEPMWRTPHYIPHFLRGSTPLTSGGNL